MVWVIRKVVADLKKRETGRLEDMAVLVLLINCEF